MLEGLDINGGVKGVSQHPARPFQVVVVAEEVAKKEEFLVGALTGNFREDVARVPADPLVIHLRKVAKPRYAFFSPEGQLLLDQAHRFRVVVPQEAHNGVALCKHLGNFLVPKRPARKSPRASPGLWGSRSPSG